MIPAGDCSSEEALLGGKSCFMKLNPKRHDEALDQQSWNGAGCDAISFLSVLLPDQRKHLGGPAVSRKRDHRVYLGSFYMTLLPASWCWRGFVQGSWSGWCDNRSIVFQYEPICQILTISKRNRFARTCNSFFLRSGPVIHFIFINYLSWILLPVPARFRDRGSLPCPQKVWERQKLFDKFTDHSV
jgi:hypothetical protein